MVPTVLLMMKFTEVRVMVVSGVLANVDRTMKLKVHVFTSVRHCCERWMARDERRGLAALRYDGGVDRLHRGCLILYVNRTRRETKWT